MKKTIFVALGLTASMLLSACGANDESESNGTTGENNVATENEALDIKQLVNDYSVGNLEAESTSINSHQLIVKNGDDQQETYALPEDEFFVSIAPYIDQTHP